VGGFCGEVEEGVEDAFGAHVADRFCFAFGAVVGGNVGLGRGPALEGGNRLNPVGFREATEGEGDGWELHWGKPLLVVLIRCVPTVR
jgi:hypothetical protein